MSQHGVALPVLGCCPPPPPPPSEGEQLSVGRSEQQAKYADRLGERSPNLFKVGCDATEVHGHTCQLCAGTFMRALSFSSSGIDTVPGLSHRNHEAELLFQMVEHS
ncbi:unnamed protein product [Prorocentrum cordatum]|uniref:Uncharacterized protein n=1 Tax=Prorocentrum cordatum TaxID=2364126 RepID=A0ABN9XU21_9DINO|nr:unnamed protein product [Polarella glacialis]